MKKLEEYDWLCPQPFTNWYSSILGGTQPCCVIQNWYTSNKKIRGTGTVSLEEDYNSSLNKSFRNEFLNGAGPIIEDCCRRCVKNEKHGKTSHRLSYLNEYLTGSLKHRKEELETYLETDRSEPLIMTMEYKVKDNYCNLKCNMCRSISSSTLAKENVELEKQGHILTSTHRLPRPFNGKFHYKRKESFKDLDNVLKTLSILELVGGETLAIPQNYELLDRIIELGVSKNIEVKITTNATIIPKINDKTIFDYVPYFKKIKFLVSIEFWGEKNNYLRYGSNWDDIMNNVIKFKEHDIHVSWHSTVNALNVGYLNEMPMKQKFTGLVEGPGEIYSIASVPPDIKEQYLKKDNPEKIVSYLKDTDWDEKQMWTMLKDIQVRDRYRKTCLIDVFPEWEKYYENINMV
jgi:sulfatase maturation enzyme AslB (radical SAM superfamily)